MRPTTSTMLCALCAFAATAANGQSSRPSQTIITSTSLFTFVTFNGPDRLPSTGTRTIIVTTTQPLTQSIPNNATTVSGNNTANAAPTGNSTSSSSSQTPSNLPTAPTTIAAGGGTAGAPLPGATGGAYGPDDQYIAAGSSLQSNAVLVGLCGFVLTGALIVL